MSVPAGDRRLLLIAYAFPPAGGAGVQRTARFVQYLPEQGWHPTVLTVVPSCYGIRDETEGDRLPQDLAMIRTWHLDPVAQFTRPGDPTVPSEREASGRRGTSWGRLARRAARTAWAFLDRHLLIPDSALLWCPRAILAGLVAHRKRPFDLIYATGEPYSCYLTARILAKLTGLAYVLDMRDPWTLAPYRSVRHSWWRRGLEKAMEVWVLRACAVCIFANHALDLYAETFPAWAAKLRYLPNGYDEPDFEDVAPRVFERFTIVHTGTFLEGYRTPDAFLAALAGLVAERPDLRSALQVLFVGKVGFESGVIERLGLRDIVRQVGYVPHRQSLSYLLGADLLLLVGGHHAWEETGKVFEYMATGRPILAAVHPEGGAARVVRDYPGSRIVDRQDIRGIQGALEQALAGGRLQGQRAPPIWVRRHNRRDLTTELARVLDESARGR
jgi:glycosyltransferase involved in cell wall biosynthesis